MPEHKVYRLDVPIHFNLETGLDPATLPDHRTKQMFASYAAMTCESLFWVVEQFGNMVQNDGWIYEEDDLANALQRIGEIGRAMAGVADEQAQYLEQIADRLSQKSKKGSGGDARR